MLTQEQLGTLSDNLHELARNRATIGPKDYAVFSGLAALAKHFAEAAEREVLALEDIANSLRVISNKQ